MLKKFSNTISVLFHPVFLPSYLVLGLNKLAPLPLFYTFMSSKLFWALFGLIFSYTALIPLLFIFLLKRLGFVSDLQISNRDERPKVYLFTSGFYFALAYFLISKGSVFVPTATLVAAMACVILGLFLFTFFDKISAHTSGMGGVVGVLAGIAIRYSDKSVLPYLLLVLILLGVVASARLYLGAHNLRQTSLGAIWGGLIGFGATYFFMII